MDGLFHFLFALITLYAAGVHVKHHPYFPALLAFLAFAPDLDHFLPGGWGSRALFHNVFAVLLIPLVFVLIAFAFEKKGVFWRETALVVLLVLVSHTMLDLFSGSVPVFWPVSGQAFSLEGYNLVVPLPAGKSAVALSSFDIGIICYLLLLLAAAKVEKVVEAHDRMRGAGKPVPAVKPAKKKPGARKY